MEISNDNKIMSYNLGIAPNQSLSAERDIGSGPGSKIVHYIVLLTYIIETTPISLITNKLTAVNRSVFLLTFLMADRVSHRYSYLRVISATCVYLVFSLECSL